MCPIVSGTGSLRLSLIKGRKTVVVVVVVYVSVSDVCSLSC